MSKTKVCKKCQTEKALTEFFDHKTNRDGKAGICKKCATAAKKERRRLYGHENRDYKKEESQRDKQKRRNNWLKRYGLTVRDFEEILAIQKNLCPICDQPFTENERPRVDHCHDTGQVRGLLHNKCNIALGLFSENVQALQNAIVYLGEWKKTLDRP